MKKIFIFILLTISTVLNIYDTYGQNNRLNFTVQEVNNLLNRAMTSIQPSDTTEMMLRVRQEALSKMSYADTTFLYSRVKTFITDSLNLNTRNWQTAQQVRQIVSDSAQILRSDYNIKINNKLDKTALNDSLAPKNYLSKVQIESLILDSLQSNSRNWQSLQDLLRILADSMAVLRSLIQGQGQGQTLPVSNFVGIAADSKIKLSWEYPAQSDSVVIERKKSILDTNFVRLTKLTPPNNTYVDFPVINDVTYQYRIRNFFNNQSSDSVMTGSLMPERLKQEFFLAISPTLINFNNLPPGNRTLTISNDSSYTMSYIISIPSPFNINGRNLIDTSIASGGTHTYTISVDTNNLAPITYVEEIYITNLRSTQSVSLIYTKPPSGNSWFVDSRANGSNNGTSWANAWTSFANINWSAINPNDVIYISGGTDSIVYNQQLAITRAGLNNVTITKGTDAGYNGKVILDGQGTLSYGILVETSNVNAPINNITVKNITVRHYSSNNILVRYNTKRIYFDSLEVTGVRSTGINVNGWNADLKLVEIDSIFIRWCRIISDYQTTNQTDLIGMGYAKGLYIINNYLHQANITEPGHNDNIQTVYTVGNLYVAGNILINDKLFNSQCVMSQASQPGYKTIVFNNVFFSKGESTSWADASDNGRPTGQFHFFNNSAYIENPDGGTAGYPVYTGSDTVYIYNNILFSKGYYTVHFLFPFKVNPNTYFIDYNIHETAYPNENCYYINNTARDLSYVRATYGFDIHSIKANPNYISLDLNNFNLKLQSNSPAINAGITLSAPYDKDIDGVRRPRGSSWDIGAFEYVP